MLTPAELLTIHRALRTTRVLSLYVDFTPTDPAAQRAWRVQLEHRFSELERAVGDASRDERVQFARCRDIARERLADLDSDVGSPKYVGGRATHIDTVRAHRVVEHGDHMGTPPRVGFHAGTRGIARRDAAQRSLRNGRDRMIVEVAQRVVQAAGDDAWVAVGGVKRVVSALMRHITPIASERILELASLDVHSSEADVAAAARSAASTLRNAADLRRLAELADQRRPGGRAAFGPRETERALMDRAVQDLYITRTFREARAAQADAAIRMALDQDAVVEEASGDAAALLDEHGGIAAGLRFSLAGESHMIGAMALPPS